MEKIGIVCEDVVDLPQDIVEKNQIALAPAKLYWPEIENLPGENTFQKMRELEKRGIKSFGKTSQPSMKDFLDKYTYQLERFEKVICITITSKHSGSYNSAIQAKKFLEPDKQERVFVVDSLNGTAGHALLVLKAADLIKTGKEAKEIVLELENFTQKIHCHLMVDDPKWLEASGRISPLIANLIREMSKAGIRPLLTFKNGKLTPGGIKIKAKDIPSTLFKQFEAETKKLRAESKKIRITITHGDDWQGANRLKEMIEKESKDNEMVFVNIMDNIIGAPTGPNTLVLAWCEI